MSEYVTIILITGLLLCSIMSSAQDAGQDAIANEPLMDWSMWEQYRGTVKHPSGYIQQGDIENARANIERYEWARSFAEKAEADVKPYLARITPEFLEMMLEQQTSMSCYQCPACRDKGLAQHPGGAWSWSLDNPEVMKCKNCGTVFPNEDYPESIVLECKSEAGREQKFSFYGGETFKQWGYGNYRPTFTGGIRKFKVGWCQSMVYRFALAYALTKKPEYAEATRMILLRFAEVYPRWLLVSTYGEIADMDPHVSGLTCTALPEDELVYPPNKPNRDLYAGYWASCRAGGGGQEGYFTNSVLQAYEFTCDAEKANGAPLYTEEERLKIERDLILESCVHLIGEKKINNKSVGNRIAVARVGMAMGHPGFVRFGLEGWRLTMDGWFLDDGGTPESPAYAMMSLDGIYSLGQAIRGYSDPEGYVDENGERIEGLNLYEGFYAMVWQRMFEGLQGNLLYPPYADSYRTTGLGSRFAELLASNYPDNLQYLALLKEYAGEDLAKGHAETALFFRAPGLEEVETPPLQFEDDFIPVLSLGQLRTGEQGRKSLALLSGVHWGGHHHSDSLNLYYWKDGHELLTDLGYLWDHPHAGMTRRTFSHNTGMVDLAGQVSTERGGYFDLFHIGDRVKVMEASSQAYANADVYRRTVVQVDHAPENSYLVDLFRLRAPGMRDLVYHGPNSDYELNGIELVEGDIAAQEARVERAALRFKISGDSDEIYVDDVSIKLADGTDIAANPSAAELNEETGTPVGWNRYSGSGKAEWGASTPGRTDDRCAYLKALSKGNDNDVNQALIQGNSNGYQGTDALELPAGASGTVTFWIRGNGAQCNVSIVRWPNDPKNPGDRVDVGLRSVTATEEWTQHTVEFSFSRSMDIENMKSANSPELWTARWNVAEDLQLSALHCGDVGELVYVGDGWGQRDHRDSDVGVTIPYIIRRHPNDGGVTGFCTVYEGHAPDEGIVTGAYRPAIPAELRDNVLALIVETTGGFDLIISQLEPAEITLKTEFGEVATDSKVAVISFSGEGVQFAALAEGTMIALNGEELAVDELLADEELDRQVVAE